MRKDRDIFTQFHIVTDADEVGLVVVGIAGRVGHERDPQSHRGKRRARAYPNVASETNTAEANFQERMSSGVLVWSCAGGCPSYQ